MNKSVVLARTGALFAALLAAAPLLAQPAAVNLGTLASPSSTSAGFNLNTSNIVWLRFNLASPVTPGNNRFLDIDTVGSGTLDTEIGLYDNTGLRIADDDDDGEGNRSALSFGIGSGNQAGLGGATSNGRDGSLAPGQYYLAVGQFNTTFGASAFSVTSTSAATGGIAGVTIALGSPVPPPANADCASATPVSGPGPFSYDTSGGGIDVTDACEGNNSASVWFSYTAPVSGATGIQTCGLSVLDTVLAVYDSCGGTLLACNDDFCGQRSRVIVTMSAGSTYFIRVSHFGTAFGPGAFEISPGLLAGTGSATPDPVTEGQPVVLTVSVTPAAAPPSTGISVGVDATSISGGFIALHDDGVAPDVIAGDNVYSGGAIAAPFALGPASLPFSVSDAQSRVFSGNIAFTVVGTPTGACCQPDNTCTIERQYVCVAGGGSFAGPGTDCGGPGYLVTPGGPAFEDISGTGTPVSGSPGDDNVFTVAMPFPFSYYGAVYSSVSVSTNGNLQFPPSNSSEFDNVPIPDPAPPNNMIAPLWDDFNFNANTIDGLHTQFLDPFGTNPRFIVQWTSVAQFGAGVNTDFSTFQVALFPDGRIQFRYGAISPDFTLGGDALGATVGLEDLSGGPRSIHVGTGADPVAGGTSILFTPSMLPGPCVNTCGGGAKIFEQIDFAQQIGQMVSQSAACPGCFVPRSYACLDDFEINGLEGAPPGPPTLVSRAEALVLNTGAEPLRWRVNLYTSRTNAESLPLGDQYHEEFLTPSCSIPNYSSNFPGFTLVAFDLGTGFNRAGSRVLSLGTYWMSIVAVTDRDEPDVYVGLGDLLDPNVTSEPNAFQAVYLAGTPGPGGDTGLTNKNAAYRLRTQGPCPADFNADGEVNPDDLGDFITCYFAESEVPGICPQADFNHDANLDPDDLGDFITGYFGGLGDCAP